MASNRRLGWVERVRRESGWLYLLIKLDTGQTLWHRMPAHGIPVGMVLGRRCELVPWGHGLALWGR